MFAETSLEEVGADPILLTVMSTKYRVKRSHRLIADNFEDRDDLSFSKWIRTIATDSHFLVPLVVLLAGVALLVVLH